MLALKTDSAHANSITSTIFQPCHCVYVNLWSIICSIYFRYISASVLTIIETDQEGSASETEEGLGTIQEAEEYGQSTLCTLYKSIH